MSKRAGAGRYEDPLDLVWVATAQGLGMRIERSREVFASWDGAGRLRLGAPEDLDPDDSLAQLVLHEICHALVEGPAAFSRPDWGLDNRTTKDLVREHACHRLQAALLAPHGLRRLLAPTTDERAYYDALPDDPLADGDDPALPPARAGYHRAREGPWAAELARALSASAALVGITRPFAPPGSPWSGGT